MYQLSKATDRKPEIVNFYPETTVVVFENMSGMWIQSCLSRAGLREISDRFADNGFKREVAVSLEEMRRVYRAFLNKGFVKQ